MSLTNLSNYKTMDPFILYSAINMLLRDHEYEDLDDLCNAQELDKEVIIKRLKDLGFVYDESSAQFK